MRVSSIDEMQNFMHQLASTNIKIPENLALNLTEEEQQKFISEYEAMYKFNNSSNKVKLNKINTQFGSININTEI